MNAADEQAQEQANVRCRSCRAYARVTDNYCMDCGFPLRGTPEEQRDFIEIRRGHEMEMDLLRSKIVAARNTLFVLGGFFLVYGLMTPAFKRADENTAAILVSNLSVALMFVLLGVWASTKPVASIVSGMVLYLLLQLINFLASPSAIFHGIILKIIIASFLVKGLRSAWTAEKLRKQYQL
ncbi:MAG TPA: hypothetical protein VL307_19655 [Chitinophagaceae bacterium]|nr:hypothetical protein [Chitinophagaceae bacterium]